MDGKPQLKNSEKMSREQRVASKIEQVTQELLCAAQLRDFERLERGLKLRRKFFTVVKHWITPEKELIFINNLRAYFFLESKLSEEIKIWMSEIQNEKQVLSKQKGVLSQFKSEKTAQHAGKELDLQL